MTRVKCISILAFLFAPAAMAEVFPPRGTRAVHVSRDYPGFSYRQAMNNVGQIVWAWTPDPNDLTQMEILLYDHGQVTQITDNSIIDTFPDINDDGTIVWCSATGLDDELEIWRWQDGHARRLVDRWPPGTIPQQYNGPPAINNLGHIVWQRAGLPQCSEADGELWFYDGMEVRQLTHVGLSNQGPSINDQDQVVWTHYDFCQSPRRSTIMLYSDGQVTELTSAAEYNAFEEAINNDGLIAWNYGPVTGDRYPIAVYHRGVATDLTNDGDRAAISDSGRIVFERNSSPTTSQLWMYEVGDFVQLTDDESYNEACDVGADGSIVWLRNGWPITEVWAFLRRDLGDLNCDGAVTIADAGPFVMTIADIESFRIQFPACDELLGDFTLDGAITVSDIAGFVQCLLR